MLKWLPTSAWYLYWVCCKWSNMANAVKEVLPCCQPWQEYHHCCYQDHHHRHGHRHHSFKPGRDWCATSLKTLKCEGFIKSVFERTLKFLYWAQAFQFLFSVHIPPHFFPFISFQFYEGTIWCIWRQPCCSTYVLPHLANFGQFAIFRARPVWNGCLEIAAEKCAHIYQTRIFSSYFPPNFKYCTT